MRLLSGVGLLSAATLQSFARDPRALRSVVWPMFLTPLALGCTLIVLTTARAPARVIAVNDTELHSHFAAAGWTVLASASPRDDVASGRTSLATDGSTIWTTAHADRVIEADHILRTNTNAAWRMEVARSRPERAQLLDMAAMLVPPLSLLYVLYGLVFSLGSLSRDRESQVLDVEFALPLPTWAPVLARWVATIILLVPAHALSVGILHALLPSADPLAFVGRGTGAIAAAAAIGVAVTRGPGVKQSFSTAFAAASIAVAGLFAIGPLLPMGNILPLASLLTGGPALPSLMLGLACGPIAAGVFALRAGRQ